MRTGGENKVAKGFSTTDVPLEFCLLQGEVAEAFDAWRKGREDAGEELADVAVYLLGLAEITVCHQLASGADKFLRLPGLPLLDPDHAQHGQGRYPGGRDGRIAREGFSQRRSRRVPLTGQVKR